MLRYDRILNELSQIIYERYIYAYRAYDTNQFEEARKTLEELRTRYYRESSPSDELANHIRKLRNAAQKRAN